MDSGCTTADGTCVSPDGTCVSTDALFAQKKEALRKASSFLLKLFLTSYTIHFYRPDWTPYPKSLSSLFHAATKQECPQLSRRGQSGPTWRSARGDDPADDCEEVCSKGTTSSP